MDGHGDRLDHLRRRRGLLAEWIEHLQRVLDTLETTMEAHAMGINLTPQERLEVFGEHDPGEYADEAEQRWGDTDAWRQSRARTSGYSKQDWVQVKAEAAAVDARFAAALAAGEPADGTEAMAAAEQHRQHLDRWFYDCPPRFQVGLALMYVSDPRFSAGYEQVAPGLAQYVHDAIVANAARPDAAG